MSLGALRAAVYPHHPGAVDSALDGLRQPSPCRSSHGVCGSAGLCRPRFSATSYGRGYGNHGTTEPKLPKKARKRLDYDRIRLRIAYANERDVIDLVAGRGNKLSWNNRL